MQYDSYCVFVTFNSPCCVVVTQSDQAYRTLQGTAESKRSAPSRFLLFSWPTPRFSIEKGQIYMFSMACGRACVGVSSVSFAARIVDVPTVEFICLCLRISLLIAQSMHPRSSFFCKVEFFFAHSRAHSRGIHVAFTWWFSAVL